MFTTIAQPKNVIRQPKALSSRKAPTVGGTTRTRRSFAAVLFRALAAFAV
jgi:hypothetical protein